MPRTPKNRSTLPAVCWDKAAVPLGLYIHVPFCVRKCPYCDFYSVARPDEEAVQAYVDAVVRELEAWAARLAPCRADTLYFGGGTPSLLTGAQIAQIIEAAAHGFGLNDAEITLEANPAEELDERLYAFAAAGGNRVSLGMQSAHDGELALLGRRHDAAAVWRAAEAVDRAGIDNFSLDAMLGLPGQNEAAVVQTVAAAAAVGAAHVSAYLLSIEPGTPFDARRAALGLPNEEQTVRLYEAVADALTARGYRHYEISNFARPGRESRHNLKYWSALPYLGVGPGAHSFVGGQRFAYARDWQAFVQGAQPVTSAPNASWADGSEEEYVLLRLRLAEGVVEEEFTARFGHTLPEDYRRQAAALPAGLAVVDNRGIRLTRRGWLVSNTVIAHILG